MAEMSDRQRRALEQWETGQRPMTPEPSEPRLAAGWYPRADMPGTQGYWDGAKWTGQVAPLAPTAKREQWTSGDRWMEMVGWIGAIVLPIVGIGVGAVMISRKKDRGANMIVLSLLMIVVYVGVWR